MAENIECEVCGGSDFYKEAGYFYCKECQTQSQEVREHVFQDEIADLKGLKKVKKAKSEKVDSKITSWECYNIIMCSLTDQLIDLGADKNLKPIVKCLWMKYLKKLEVFDLKKDVKPRLQLVNSKRDLDILYGVQKKKRKRKKSSDESTISLDSSSTKRERSKKKRALAQAHYEQFSQKSTLETSSLHNETLTSLKSPSEKSENNDELISFNKYSIKELRKTISTKHINEHRLDKEHHLQCHKLTYDDCSRRYQKEVCFLSPVKLYTILYIALLINRDRLQLGDLFRFIREGHLTFNNYTELFPEEYMDKFLNIQNNSKNNLFSNRTFRVTAAKMAIFLDVVAYIKVIDLTDLCQRFCNEMNLPAEIYEAVRNIISKVNPKLTFTDKTKTIPNYEGRAMSIILFTLKLLFGLDGATEQEMSKYARSVNKLDIGKPKMFDMMQWMEYIAYRSFLVSERHFPSMYMENSDEIDSDLFLQCIKSQGIKPDENAKLTKEMKGYKELLTKIINDQEDDCPATKYVPSLTPFLEYSQLLNAPKYNLKCNFQDDSLDFLLRPNKYLSLVSDDLRLEHGGANDDWVMEELKSYKQMKTLTRSLRLIPIQIVSGGSEKDIDETLCSKPKAAKKKSDPRYVQETYYNCRKHIFRKNEIYVNRVSKEVKLEDDEKIFIKSDEYSIHYNPYERYWMYLHVNIDIINKNDFETFFNKHTSTFRIVFNECARIIEQTAQDLMIEFQFSELFLVFCATFCESGDKWKKEKLLDNNLKYYVNRAKAHW